MNVLNIMLKSRGSVSVALPHAGQRSLVRWSARQRFLHVLQSTIMSWKFSRWPDARQTSGDMRIDVSTPTTSSRSSTMFGIGLDITVVIWSCFSEKAAAALCDGRPPLRCGFRFAELTLGALHGAFGKARSEGCDRSDYFESLFFATATTASVAFF